MTLNQLRYFRVLAKTEHYSKAADALGISQPSLSRAISLLEEELNVLLFTRRGRNVVLTDAGRALLRYVEAGLDTLDAGAAAMRDYRTGAGRVTIGSITPVVELPFVVAMRRDDPLASCTEVTPGQLAGRPMVFTDSPAYADLLHRMLEEYGVRPEVRGFSNEDAVLLGMVQAGMGVFISSEHPQMYSPETVLVPLRQDRYHRYVYMVTRPGLASSPAAAQLIRYNQNRAVKEHGRQPRAYGGTDP